MLLVIGFLAIIFSQITSVGISNYGVKKMLPSVILVVIQAVSAARNPPPRAPPPRLTLV